MAPPYTLATRAKMTVSGTPGAGTITLSTAISGYQTFGQAGVTNGATVPYVIEDGANWEVGYGNYNTTGPTLSRGAVYSSNANAAISATSAAVVYIAPQATDLQAGTNANQLVMLNASAQLPAVSGVNLTNLNGSNIASGTVAATYLPVGTTANKIVQLDASAKLPAVDGSALTNLTAANLTGTINAAQLPNPGAASLGGVKSYGPIAHQFLTQLGTNGAFSSTQPVIGDVSGWGTNVATALTNTANAASGIVVLDASATPKLPAVDGSQLVNLPSTAGPAFFGVSGTVGVMPGSTTQVIPTATFDTTSNYNGSTGVYTPNKAGYYMVCISTSWSGIWVCPSYWQTQTTYASTGHGISVMSADSTGVIYKNGAWYAAGTGPVLVYLNGTTDNVSFYALQNNSNGTQGAAWYQYPDQLTAACSAIWLRS